MRTLFISDCHLGITRSQMMNYSHIFEQFEFFLHNEANHADALYILGDLFEYWIGDDYISPEIEKVLASLQQLSKKIPIYFLHGNRDYLIGKDFAKKSGCTILKQPITIKIKNIPILIMHGDSLCTDDIAYLRYRAIAQNPLTKAIFTKININLRIRIMEYIRQKSAQATSKKTNHIMDVNENTVIRYMRHFNVNHLIHGHTHRPAIHKINLGDTTGTRFVLGDWYQQGNFLSFENGEIKYEQLKFNP